VVVASKALTITDEDFIVAAKTLAELVPQEKLKDGCCYPDLSNIREVSQKIAAAVAKSGRSDRRDLDGGDHEDWLKHCKEEMYEPTYPDLVTPGYYEEEDPVPTWRPPLNVSK
jgi:malic enzyme